MSTYSFFNNRAGMELQHNTLALNPQQAEWIENLHLNRSGRWSNAGIGNRQLNLSAALGSGTAVRSLQGFTDANGVTHTLAQAGGSLYEIQLGSETAVSLTSGLTATGPLRSTSFLGWLMLVGQSQAPLRWNGQSAPEPLPNWPPTIAGVTVGQPSLVTTFTNRLVVSGDANNPAVIYLSELENPENFTPGSGAASAGAIQISPGDGDRIVALNRLFLPVSNQEVLVIFKQHSIYLLTGQDAQDYTLQRVASGVGAVNQESVVNLGNALLFLTPQKTIVSLNTNLLVGNLSISEISGSIAPQLQLANTPGLNNAFALNLPERGEVWWWIPLGSSSVNNQVLVYNVAQGGVWSLRTGLQAVSGLAQDGLVLTGDNVGHLSKQLTGSTYNGASIEWRYRTAYYDLGDALLRKRLKEIDLYLQQATEAGLTLITRWDLQPQASDTVLIGYPAIELDRTLLYGSAVFGQSVFGTQSASTVRICPSGSGRLLQLEWQGHLPQQSVELEGWLISTHFQKGRL